MYMYIYNYYTEMSIIRNKKRFKKVTRTREMALC